MPFGSYHGIADRTLTDAVRIFQQTGANALKLEGAGNVIDTIRLLTGTGIPIVAHLGLLPQSAAVVGGYKVQGKTAEAAQQLIDDARACEAAGAFMVVLECIPYQLGGTSFCRSFDTGYRHWGRSWNRRSSACFPRHSEIRQSSYPEIR